MKKEVTVRAESDLKKESESLIDRVFLVMQKLNSNRNKELRQIKDYVGNNRMIFTSTIRVSSFFHFSGCLV